MMKRSILLCTSAALALGPVTLSTTFAPPQAHAAVCDGDVSNLHIIRNGHQDLSIISEGGSISTALKDEPIGGGTNWLESGQFAIAVSDKLQRPLDFLDGFSGDAWVLPFTQDSDYPWVGFNTQRLDPSALNGSSTVDVHMQLNAGPGRILAWQPLPVEGNKIHLDSDSPSQAWSFTGNGHEHMAFTFTERGTYDVTFSFELSDGSTHDIDAMFLVGSDAAPEDLCKNASGNSKSKSKTEQLADDVKGIDKAVAALDKEMGKLGKEARAFIGVSEAPSGEARASRGRSGQSTEPSERNSKQAKSTTQNKASGNGGGTEGNRGGTNGNNGNANARNAASASGSGRGNSAGSESTQRSAGRAAAASNGGGRDGAANGNRAASTSAAAGDRGRGGADNSGNDGSAGAAPVDAQIAAAASAQSAPTFWAGLMAGIGGAALLAGAALLTYVTLSRRQGAGAAGASAGAGGAGTAGAAGGSGAPNPETAEFPRVQ